VPFQICKVSWKFGSVRREIFIAIAQTGAANSLHPLTLNPPNSLKSMGVASVFKQFSAAAEKLIIICI